MSREIKKIEWFQILSTRGLKAAHFDTTGYQHLGAGSNDIYVCVISQPHQAALLNSPAVGMAAARPWCCEIDFVRKPIVISCMTFAIIFEFILTPIFDIIIHFQLPILVNQR